MPSSSVWYCCNCGLGPWNVEFDASCPNCYTDRCGCCRSSTISISYSDHTRGMAATETHPETRMASVYACNTYNVHHATMQSPLPLPGGYRPQLSSLAPSSMSPTAIRANSNALEDDLPGHDIFNHGSHMNSRPLAYYCCQCDDGPKLFDVQPICIVCNHVACQYCKTA